MVYGADGSAGGRSRRFFGFGFWFCILPSLLIGLGMWDEKNRKYKYLLGGICGTCLSKKDPGKRREEAVIWDWEFDGRIFRLYYFCICYIDDERHRQSRLYV